MCTGLALANYAREIKKILRENGFFFHRQAKGDHEIWRNDLTDKQISVDGKILSRHTANEVLK